WITIGQRGRNQSPNECDCRRVEPFVRRRIPWLDEVEWATRNNTAPIKEPGVLIHLECDTTIAKNLTELTGGRRAPINPAARIDIMNRHDTDPVVQSKSDPSDAVA